ncbi:receptor-type tyrosine-protein phosphatase T-like [Mytilus californianus]|uniref:receptor-type tyrosine-protein phosphatase T-like n=1 Tax=Mytilus californianus TaxID=6549 RepID=UPI0022466FC8|nr:receptor-type tyrosine-protein phosphatase T-like [Mytilus californianus]
MTCYCLTTPCNTISGKCPPGGCEKGWHGESCEGPKKVTVRDFWHMIWQENVGKIVMVTPLEENRRNAEERKLHHFHFTQWPDHGVPDSTKLVNYYRKVKIQKCDQNGPMIVHCSAGIGRTGTFIAIDALYEHGNKVGYVNVMEYIKMMRKDRMNMVQTYVGNIVLFRERALP